MLSNRNLISKSSWMRGYWVTPQWGGEPAAGSARPGRAKDTFRMAHAQPQAESRPRSLKLDSLEESSFKGWATKFTQSIP
jgi:hypothetical protein